VAVPELLHRLLTTPGPPGAEAAAAAVWREAAAEFADVRGDAAGNSFAHVAGAGDGPRLALFGHIDEIGLTVTHVEDSGLLAFRGLGGWDPQTLVAQRVELLTRSGPLPGVIGVSRDWTGRDDDKRAPVKDLHIDIGARDGAEARGLVRVGDAAVLASEPLELRNGRFASRGLDNRIGAYIVLEVARSVAADGGGAGEVVAVASVQEEVGDFLGARTAAFALEPDVAVAVDITFATDVPGAQEHEHGRIEIGGGPALMRGPGIPPKLFDLLADTAEREGISCSIEVITGKANTDADGVYASRGGVPTATVSVPIRYFHTPVELVELEDVEATIALLSAFVRRLEPGVELAP
jgi:endoglucanase